MKIIITDTCYLDDHGEDFYDKVLEEFDAGVDPYTMLTISYKAVVSDTGFGDWGNRVYSNSPLFRIDTAFFGADSGMVTAFVADDSYSHDMGAVVQIDDSVALDDLTLKVNDFNPEWKVIEIFYKDELVLSSENNAFTYSLVPGFKGQLLSEELMSKAFASGYNLPNISNDNHSWYDVDWTDDLWLNTYSKEGHTHG